MNLVEKNWKFVKKNFEMRKIAQKYFKNFRSKFQWDDKKIIASLFREAAN